MHRLLLPCSLIALAALGNVRPVLAQIAAPASVWQIKLPPGSHETAIHGAAQLFGFPVQIRVFEAPIAVPQLIRFLSTQLLLLRDLHVLKGSVLLSGQADGRSWVVHLQGMASGGARGTLSLLENAVSGRLDPVRPHWIPDQAHLLLDLRTTEGTWVVTEQIWSHSLAPKAMLSTLQTALTRLGWKRTGAEFGGGSWQRDQQGLVYSVVDLDGGSAVFARIRQRT